MTDKAIEAATQALKLCWSKGLVNFEDAARAAIEAYEASLWSMRKEDDCRHLQPEGHPEPNTQKKMHQLAHEQRRFSIQWGVVHPGHAGFATVFMTKREAEAYRKKYARAYVVVKVCITPLYQKGDFKGKCRR